MRIVTVVIGCLLASAPWPDSAVARAQSPALATSARGGLTAEDFFERQVRPILVAHCHSCHGPRKQEAGLRLDSGEAFRRGSDSGPVVVPGVPADSPLLQAVRYDGAIKMPPKNKLPAAAVAALTHWVRAGAVWPADAVVGTGAPAGTPKRAAVDHWAFRPVRSLAVPPVRDLSRAATPIDAFIQARLEAAGLTLSAPADRRTLLRRATFDLHGLPPTADEVAAFEADPSPDAFARVVERLLASPRYGERWGRHWLDVARYADTKGYVRLRENPVYPTAWTYRDYVVRAFNEDLPYDRFVVQQLAADQLDLGDEPWPLAAMGFLTLGPRFLNSQHDIIDDRIDVVTRGLMGLTVTCARCHDHKFDPIPTRDYYSLHGVFASSTEPRVPPVLVAPSQRHCYAAYLGELERRAGTLDAFLRTRHAELRAGFLRRTGDYLYAAQREQIQANFLAVMFLVDATKDLNPVMVQRWARFLEQTRRRHHPVFTPWNELARLVAVGSGSEREFAAAVGKLARVWRARTDPATRVNPVVAEALMRGSPRHLAEVAQRYGELFQRASEDWERTRAANPSAVGLDDPDWEEVRQAVMGADGPLSFTVADIDDFLFVDTTKQNELHEHQRVVEAWIATAGAAPHALPLIDSPRPADSPVFIRGNPASPGERAPRQFLTVLSRETPTPFRQGSGRLELARAVASPENPLTARVIVNRVWLHHFGAGLVRTPGDFGVRGDPPTHPELLDYLASHFMADGWSLKRLHRAVMLSAVYRQSSDAAGAEAATRIDPENRLLWRMTRRRLDWEELRDSLLAVCGDLDSTTGGPAVDLFSSRRAVYTFTDRQDLPGILRTFDVAAPDATSPQRHQTTVPQQALFLMNSPWVGERVRHLAARLDSDGVRSSGAKVAAAYRLVFGRPPEPGELALGEQYLSTGPGTAAAPRYLTAWEEFLHALLLSNEFLFVD